MVSSRRGRRRSAPSSAGDTPSTRTAARTAQRSSHERASLEAHSSTDPQPEDSTDEITSPVARVGARMTRRLGLVLIIMAVLVISLITSLRVYVDQRHQIARANAAIASSQQHINRLDDEHERWNDPDYVRAQARTRLGWVMPGEVGYQVIDASGNPYAGEPGDDHGSPRVQQNEAWWQRLWETNQNADKPTATPSPSFIERVVAPPEPETSAGG